jgi:flagellin
MAYTINTNITSLQAQEYLRVTTDFQSKTINRVTSGLRIISSGDDAAGLAIANGFRSDRAVLTQGIRNANDGLSTLQTIDGGVNNISLLLDRARTLAAQSASGTFAGDRSVLNSEFQSVLSEIDRQAQAIGLDQGGAFAKSLAVFIGGGRSNGGVSAISNGIVSVDLSNSTVDSKSLGLKSFQADGAGGNGDFTASKTSVSAIIADNAATSTTFNFYGPGFAKTGTSAVSLSVNLSGVVDTQTLVEAVNSALQSYSATSPEGSAFRNANIEASITADGKSLAFSSTSTAFQVEAGDAAASAFLGFLVDPATDATGQAVATNNVRREAGGIQASDVLAYAGLVKATPETQVITVSTTDAAGALHTLDITLDGSVAAGATLTLDEALDQINDALQNSGDAALKNVVAVSQKDAADKIKIISTNPSFAVSLMEEVANGHGLTSGAVQNVTVTSAASGTTATADISTESGAQAAVTALATAVSSLGAAQAVVGKGQNQVNFAISLAQTQLNNLAASESRIRDADLAAEAANLTKAQILQQAGIAALAQANVAPQAVLTLLRG